jgi:hypothetical protein
MTVEPPFLREVRIRNFKSISKCAVSFRPVTLMVGRNGSGKSNFLDALRFVADGLQSSLDYAIRQRGGIDNVRRRSTGHPRNFAVEVVVSLPGQQVATYAFELAARSNGGFSVKRETLTVESAAGLPAAHFVREDARVVSMSEKNVPPVLEDRLYLVNAAGLPEFRPVYDALLSMGFYNLNPETMKEPQSPDARGRGAAWRDQCSGSVRRYRGTGDRAASRRGGGSDGRVAGGESSDAGDRHHPQSGFAGGSGSRARRATRGRVSRWEHANRNRRPGEC